MNTELKKATHAMKTEQKNVTHAVVIGIQEGIVYIKQTGERPLVKNEIIYISPKKKGGSKRKNYG